VLAVTRREMLVWAALGLVAIAFVVSLVLNRQANAELSETKRAESAAWKLTTRLYDDCEAAFDFAESALATPPGQQQRERVLIAARAAQLCLDEEAKAELRQKVLLLELSGDQNLVP